MLKRLRRFLHRATLPPSDETKLECVASSISWRQITDFAERHTPAGYQQALAFWTLSRCHGILAVFYGVPQLKAFFSRTNQDVVMFETSAFLLGVADWVLEQQIDQTEEENDDDNGENSRDYVASSAMLVGSLYEEFSGFEAAEELLLKRTTRYYCALTKSVEKFCAALSPLATVKSDRRKRQSAPHDPTQT